MSHHDLDFLEGRAANRDEILNIFGIPIGLLSENATEANATVAERQFIERTLYPKLVRIAQKITQELLPFWAGICVAEFEDIRPTDTQMRLEEIRAAYPVLSINEIRARFYDMPPVPWGDLPVGAAITEPVEKQGEIDKTNPDEATKSALDELRRWERFALKRRTTGRKFEVRALPDTIAFEIAAGLQGTSSPAEIKAVFAEARAALSGESRLEETGTEG